MKIFEVKTKEEIKQFHFVNYLLNKENPYYIQPLEIIIEGEFDDFKKEKEIGNDFNRWILKNNENELIGRIVAFYNINYKTDGTNYKLGCIGFFECINNQSAANLLFDTAKKWLELFNVEAIDGPINFNNRNNWWGLLVEGFEKYPIFGSNFNPPYYQKLFENYGFKALYNQYYYGSKSSETPDVYRIRYERFLEKPKYTIEYLDFNKIDKYVNDYVKIYNAAWAQHHENKNVTFEQIYQNFVKLKHFINPSICNFAYYDGEPIGMYLNLPDLNKYIRNFKGKMNFINKIRFLINKKMDKNIKVVGLIFGVVPKFQALGIDSYMIYDIKLKMDKKFKHFEYEIGWTGDWNPRMLNIYKKVGASQTRRLITYRFIFDENKHPFELHPVLKYERVK